MSTSPSLIRLLCCLLLLAQAPLSGCASGWKGVTQNWVAPQVPEELRQKAQVLCQYHQLLGPVRSRFPRTVNPSLYIRKADLDFPQRDPSEISLSVFDRLGLADDLSQTVQCQVTYARASDQVVSLWVDQREPAWDHLQLPREVLEAPTLEARRSAWARWVQQTKPGSHNTRHLLRFLLTREGWRADYQLPEAARSTPSAVASTRAASKPESHFVPEPLQARTEDFQEVFALLLPHVLRVGTARPQRLLGPLAYYTPTAYELSVRGQMNVKCVITVEGRVTRCRILKSLPFMEEDTLVMLYQQRYTSAALQGRPVPVDYTFHVRMDPHPGFSYDTDSSSQEARGDLRQRALFLCEYQMLEAPVPSRIAPLLNPSHLIRREDLDFLQRSASRLPTPAPPLPPDVDPSSVPCQVTKMRFDKDVATVWLERGTLPENPQQLLQQPPIPVRTPWTDKAAGPVSTHELRFVYTSSGWLADYQLPERSPGGGG